MKSTLILIIALLSVCVVKAQFNGNTVQATMINLTDTTNNVIGKMPVIPGLRRDIFLKEFSREKDSTGLYITEYKFNQPNHLSAKNVFLIFQLQKFINVEYTVDSGATDFKTKIADDKNSTSIMIDSLPANAIITVKFTSKKILVPTITGIGGELSFKKN